MSFDNFLFICGTGASASRRKVFDPLARLALGLWCMYYLLPFFLGITVVAQGQLNRQIGASGWGLPAAVALNAAVFLFFSLVFLFFATQFPSALPEALQVKTGTLRRFDWWYVIPGMCGFFLVLGLPWSFQNLGAAKSFILLVSAQVLGGLLWDFAMSGRALSWPLLSGAAMTLGGAAVILFFR